MELVDQNDVSLSYAALRFALQDAEGDFDVVLIDCAPSAKRITMCAYVAASGYGSVIIPVRLDATVLRGTAAVITEIQSVATRLRLPVPEYKILRTCVPGRMTTAERTGEAILNKFYSDVQLETLIHFSAWAIQASFVWQPIVTYAPSNRVAQDYVALGEELELWQA